MYIKAIDDECASGGFPSELAHPVKIDQETEEDFVSGWTVFEDAEKVRFEGYGGDVAGVEGEG